MLRILVWVLMLFGGSGLSLWVDSQWFHFLFTSLWFHAVCLAAGVFLLRIVMKVSRNTGRLLAGSGRVGDLPRMETNRLVTGGYYSCMRHPMHLGLLFFPWSMALITGSPFYIMILAPVEMAFILIMVKLVEEPGALKKFGDEYLEYKKSVPAFSFRPDCLKKLIRGDQS